MCNSDKIYIWLNLFYAFSHIKIKIYIFPKKVCSKFIIYYIFRFLYSLKVNLSISFKIPICLMNIYQYPFGNNPLFLNFFIL